MTLAQRYRPPSRRIQRSDGKAEKLAQIAQEIEACTQCRCQGVGKPVAGDGNPDAQLVFVGEGPGKQEAEVGSPFLGRAGKFLREAIRNVGIEEQEVLFLNVLKYLPRRGIPTARAIEHGRLHLFQQLAVVQPDIVVLMGSTAARAVFDRPLPVLNEHGRVMSRFGDPAQYFITVHPSAALRFPILRKLFASDLQRLTAILEQDRTQASRTLLDKEYRKEGS